jgi:hypothetical protein
MRRLAKFWFLPKGERRLLGEAGILLLLSNICIKVVAFKHIDRFLRAPWNDRLEGDIVDDKEIMLVQRAVSRAANIFPWQSLCLSRSIAEFIMLRRRGIPAVVLAGVRFSGASSLEAHAWVNTGLNDNGSKGSGFTTVIRIGTEAADR